MDKTLRAKKAKRRSTHSSTSISCQSRLPQLSRRYEGTRRDRVTSEGRGRQVEAARHTFPQLAGKAERLSFDVPTLPLFVHERLSTKAIIETLKSHEKRSTQVDMFDLFGDPRRSVVDQVLKAYEYKDKWVNRLILGDSLVVMNSLLNYEGLGGQVQMIYIHPPYGVKFGSNFRTLRAQSRCVAQRRRGHDARSRKW